MIYTMTFSEWINSFWKNLVSFFKGEEYIFDVPTRIIFAILIIVLGWIISKIVVFALRKALNIQPKLYFSKRKKNKKSKDQISSEATAREFIIPLVKILFWIIIAGLVLNVLGVTLSSTAGVLSAVTVALGLALQDVIGCFASGLIVLATKPISLGEYVMIKNDFGQCEGTVVKVGVMITTLNTFDGHYVYVPNSNVQKAVITNVNRDPLRRVDIKIGVAYDSDVDLVKSVLLRIGNTDARVLKDKGVTAVITDFEDSAIQFSLRVWVKDEDYWQTKFDFNERVILEFRKNGIEIPYNTFTISNK